GLVGHHRPLLFPRLFLIRSTFLPHLHRLNRSGPFHESLYLNWRKALFLHVIYLHFQSLTSESPFSVYVPIIEDGLEIQKGKEELRDFPKKFFFDKIEINPVN